jgi:hypothetical protein
VSTVLNGAYVYGGQASQSPWPFLKKPALQPHAQVELRLTAPGRYWLLSGLLEQDPSRHDVALVPPPVA